MKFSTRSLLLAFAGLPVGCGANTGFIAERDPNPSRGETVSVDDSVSVDQSDAGPNANSHPRGDVTGAEVEETVNPMPSTSHGATHDTSRSTPTSEADETTGLEEPETAGGGASDTCAGELHFFAVYEATEWTGPDIRGVNVHIDRPGSHALAFSAYEPVRWTVSTSGPEVEIERIILNGYGAQEVVVDGDVEVDAYSYEVEGNELFDTAYTWNEAWALGSPTAPVGILEEKVGRPLTTFTGCYKAGNATLNADSSVSLDCQEGRTSRHVNPPCQKASVDFLDTGTTSESVEFLPASDADAWCWMLEPLGYDAVALHQIDPQDGSAFEVTRFTSPDEELSSHFLSSGLALLDGRLVFSADAQWTQLDLGTKAVTVAGSSGYSDSVASTGSQLLTVCGEYDDELCTYDSFLDLVRQDSSRRVAADELWGSSYTVRRNLVYSARWSGNEVFVHDLESGEKLRTIQLQGFDDWNRGLSLTADRLYLAAASRVDSPACIITFDPDTGAQLNQVCVEGQDRNPEWSGLWCDGIARDAFGDE